MPPITFFILVLTALVSLAAFTVQPQWMETFILHPYRLVRNREYHRLVTSGLIHGNGLHLAINLYVFWMFGAVLEPMLGPVAFLLLYLVALVVSAALTTLKHQNNPSYRALGASGAVSGVVFGYILLNPMAELGIILLPLSIPAPIFGALYLAYSWYMGKRGQDNIGHEAHFWGAVAGMVFVLVVKFSTVILAWRLLWHIYLG